MILKNGIIISSLGGEFKVAAEGEEYVCKARGVFRNKEITPVCGDNVTITLDGDTGLITDIGERKNEIIRPPLANLDCLVFVISTCEPSPNLLLLDKFLAVAEYKGIDPIIVFTKTDLQKCDEYLEIYKDLYPTFSVDNVSGEGVLEVLEILRGKFSAFTGNSGAGKSTLLNNMFPDLNLETNEISKKLGRGKHTTRRVELYKLDGGGYIADTPGFSTFNTNMYDIIMKDELSDCFVEFKDYFGKCKFQDCSHTKENGCEIIKAVKNGEIKKSRHDNYCKMHAEASLIKPWEIKNKK